MSTSQEDLSLRLKSCAKSMLWLTLVVALVFVCVSWIAVSRYGNIGVAAAAIAGGVCLASACVALLVTGITVGTPNAASGMLLGVFLRTAIPFLVSILLVQASKPLADAGLFGMVLINYFIVLAVETVLAVWLVQVHNSPVVRQ